MRSLSLISVIILAWVIEFALPHYPLLDGLMQEEGPAESGHSAWQMELPQQRIGAGALPRQSTDAQLPVTSDKRQLQQGTRDNVFRRGMGEGGRTMQAGQKQAQGEEIASTTRRMGGMMMRSSGNGGGMGRMSANPNSSSLAIPGKGINNGEGKGINNGAGKGIDNGEGCWVIIGGDGRGGSSKSKKGASKDAWSNWGSMWGPHKVWDPQCRLPCYDDSSSKSKSKKSKSKKAKGKGKGKGGGSSSKSVPHCPPFKPTPIIPIPPAPTNMMMRMVPTRMPSMMTPTRRPTVVTRAPVPSGTRRPTVAPTAETLAPVPTATNRTNTTNTTTAAPAQRSSNSTAPARRF